MGRLALFALFVSLLRSFAVATNQKLFFFSVFFFFQFQITRTKWRRVLLVGSPHAAAAAATATTQQQLVRVLLGLFVA